MTQSMLRGCSGFQVARGKLVEGLPAQKWGLLYLTFEDILLSVLEY
jgi:hypothetical protein